jgi:hypothetical protein
LIIANFVAFIGIYLLLWQFAEPLGIPDNIENWPGFMRTRGFLHITLSVLLSAYVTILLDLKLRRDKWDEGAESRFFKKSFPRSQNPKFFAEIEKLVPVSKRILLVGAGINLIWEEHIFDTIIRRVQSGQAKVTICMGNPYSPHVQSRYIEEEMRNKHPSVGREGMMKNVRALMHKIEQSGITEGLTFRLFEHYPTLATLVFDKDIYVYPYAYHVLGNASPIFHFVNDGSETARFLIENAERIVRHSVPTIDVVKAREDKRHFSDDWVAIAIYIIPDKQTPLYNYGSSLLGYDIWEDELIDIGDVNVPDVRKYVGEAKIYGFHATLGDALFFTTRSAVDRVEAELKFLTEEFKAFSLTNIRIQNKFREPGEIVLLCDEYSGTVEALHHELVTRVYKTAISSNYLAGQTSKSILQRDDARFQLMLNRYGAPYILNKFQLHFTICSRAPENEAKKQPVVNLLENSYRDLRIPNYIDINEICLVSKGSRDQRWKIARRFPLSRR